MSNHDRGIVRVRMSREVVERFWARTEDGRRVTIAWGEPDADGFYDPVFTEHRDDDLLATYRASLDEQLRGLRATAQEQVALWPESDADRHEGEAAAYDEALRRLEGLRQ